MILRRALLLIACAAIVSYNGPALRAEREVVSDEPGWDPRQVLADVGRGHVAVHRDGLESAQRVSATLGEFLASGRRDDFRWDIVGTWRPGSGKVVTDLEVKVTDLVTKTSRGAVSAETAQLIATAAIKNAQEWKVPLPLLLAVLAHESKFNPLAMNYKTGDWGIAQVNQLHMDYWKVPRTKALNPRYGIRFAARKLRADIDWAKRQGSVVPERLATVAYNTGRGGARLGWIPNRYEMVVRRHRARFEEALRGASSN